MDILETDLPGFQLQDIPECLDRDFEVLRMRIYEGKDWENIQESLGIPESTFNKIKTRTRKRIKLLLVIYQILKKSGF